MSSKKIVYEYSPEGNAENHRVNLLVIPGTVSDQEAVSLSKLPHLRNIKIFRLSGDEPVANLKEVLDLILKKSLVATLHLCTACRYVWPVEWTTCLSTGQDDQLPQDQQSCLRRLTVCGFDRRLRSWSLKGQKTRICPKSVACLDISGCTKLTFQAFGEVVFRQIKFCNDNHADPQGEKNRNLLSFRHCSSVSLHRCISDQNLDLNFDFCPRVRLTTCDWTHATLQSETSNVIVSRSQLSEVHSQVYRGDRFHVFDCDTQNCSWSFYLTGGSCDPQAVLMVGNRLNFTLPSDWRTAKHLRRWQIRVDNCAMSLLANRFVQSGDLSSDLPVITCCQGHPLIPDPVSKEMVVLPSWSGNSHATPRTSNSDNINHFQRKILPDQFHLISLDRTARVFLGNNDMDLISFPAIIGHEEGCRVRFDGHNTLRINSQVLESQQRVFMSFFQTLEVLLSDRDQEQSTSSTTSSSSSTPPPDPQEEITKFLASQAELRDSILQSRAAEHTLESLRRLSGSSTLMEMMMSMQREAVARQHESKMETEKFARDHLAAGFQLPLIINTETPLMRCYFQDTDFFSPLICFYPSLMNAKLERRDEVTSSSSSSQE